MERKPKRGTAREQLDRRRFRESDIRPAVIKRPGPGYGSWVVHDTHTQDERIVSAGSITASHRPGAIVTVGSEEAGRGSQVILSSAPQRQRGTAEFSFPPLTGAEKDALGVVSADPETLAAGVVESVVTLTGYGFREDPLDTFRAVRPFNATTKTYDTDPLITLGDPVWVSVTEVTIPVSVDSTAPAGYEIRFEVERS